MSTVQLDPESEVTVAGQLRNKIALLIADGELEPGQRLPAVRELARTLGISVNTVRAAYGKLVDDGLAATRHGVGTTVRSVSADRLGTWAPRLGSDTVAVLIAGLDPFYLPLVRGIEEVAAERGILVVFADTHDSSELAGRMIRRLFARGIDGLIAVSVGGLDHDEDQSGSRSEARTTPIVYVDQPDRTGHAFLFDAEGAGHMLTRHLLEHGHERIGLVTLAPAWANMRQLYEGYVKALQEAGLRFSADLVAEVSEFSIDAGRVGLGRLLELQDSPSAVIAAGGVLALGMLQEATRRGIVVPDELAIAGYADIEAASLVEPALTMVSVPAGDCGRQAMRALSRLIAGEDLPPSTTVLDVELTVRKSCGRH